MKKDIWIFGTEDSKKNPAIEKLEKKGARFIESDDVIITGNHIDDDTMRVNTDEVVKDYPHYAVVEKDAPNGKYIKEFFRKQKDCPTRLLKVDKVKEQ